MYISIFGLSPARQANLILIKSVIVTLLMLYGLTDGFSVLEIPAAYNVLIGK